MQKSGEETSFIQSGNTSVMGGDPRQITLQRQSLVGDNQGRIAVLIAYLAFGYMYFLTVVYGIWDYHSDQASKSSSEEHVTSWAILSTCIYTFFFAMMIASHYLTMVTDPGEMPKNYEQLHEEDLPSDFYGLISLRESIYAELVVKKKMRKGELSRLSIPNFDAVRASYRSARSAQLTTSQENPLPAIEEEQLGACESGVTTNDDRVVENGQNNTQEEKNDMQLTEMTITASHAWGRLIFEEGDEADQQDEQSAADEADLSDSEEEEKTDEQIAMDFFVRQEIKKNQSLDLSTRRNTVVDRVVEKQCYTCQSLMPPYVFHCSTCKKCVAYMDHHCPWVNNCVGFYTQKMFFLFNLYALITMAYSVAVLTRNAIHQVYGASAAVEIDQLSTMVCVSLFMVYLGFLFVLVVFCDQVTIILNRLRIIDRVKLNNKRIKEKQIRKNGYNNFKVTFGGPFSWKWFVPIAPKTPLSVEQLYN